MFKKKLNEKSHLNKTQIHVMFIVSEMDFIFSIKLTYRYIYSASMSYTLRTAHLKTKVPTHFLTIPPVLTPSTVNMICLYMIQMGFNNMINYQCNWFPLECGFLDASVWLIDLACFSENLQVQQNQIKRLWRVKNILFFFFFQVKMHLPSVQSVLSSVQECLLFNIIY